MNHNDRLSGYYAGGASLDETRHRVLRNTYWLLALSLVPTVLGAWLGMATGIGYVLTGWLRLVVFLGGAFAFIWILFPSSSPMPSPRTSSARFTPVDRKAHV